MKTDLPSTAPSAMTAAQILPVICVEEHGELLIAMAWATEHRGLPDVPAALLHVDHHADLDIPRVSTSLAGLPRTVFAIRNAVQHQISISSFIFAGTYLGFLDEVYWLSPASPFAGIRTRASYPPKHLLVATTDAERREFLTFGQRAETADVGNDDRRPLAVHFIDTAWRRQFRSTWILGIDLDYFSCNSAPEAGFRIQVTEAEYDAVCNDMRHPLRLSVYHRVVPARDSEGHWLEFDMFPPRTADPLVRTTAEIGNSIEALRMMLQGLDSQPALVVVARSRLSGFTPMNQWQFIETSVLNMLRSVYDCETLEGDRLW